MITHKKTVSFKANKNDIDRWKSKAKERSMTLSAFVLDTMAKGDTPINTKSKEWLELISYYKDLHKGRTDSLISRLVSELVSIDKSTDFDADVSLSVTYGQLASLNAFLTTFLHFAIQSES